MADMIKFCRGKLANLPTVGIKGTIYITTDEGAIYYCADDGIKMLGNYAPTDHMLSQSGVAADAKAVGDALSNKITAPHVASVGQIITVKSVDENGKPLEWESVDPSVFIDENAGKKTADVPRVYFTGPLPTTKDDVLAEMTYISKTETFHSYITIKCQGTSSMSYPKKNFTIKLFEDVDRTVKLKKDFMGWGQQNKFCLKANYIDQTHARNIICARLWSDACETREHLNERLAAAPNNGAIDGFHIKVYSNGVYQGLYTWNIPKDGWMFGMDDNGNEAVYCCEVQDARGQFRQEVVVDESDWSLEYPKEDEVNSSVKDGFNSLIRVVKDTTDEEFIAQIPTVLDMDAAIDYYLFCYYFAALDQLGKNMLMVTYDGGVTWIPSAYDNDSTWGSYWDGNSMVAYDYACPKQYECSNSLLWERIENLFGERLYARYQELTGVNGPWSLPSIITKIENFYNIPRHELYAEDKEIFTGIPQGVNLKSMRNYMANRKPYVDKCLEEIGVYITLDSIEFNRSNIILGPSEYLRLKLIYNPSNARNKNVSFSLNDDTYLTMEEDGQGYILIYAANTLINNQTYTITATSEENNCTAVLNITTSTSAQLSRTAPVITFDSKDYNNGTWIDFTSNISMTFNGTPAALDDGVYFDGTQTFYFSNYKYSNSDIAIEFLGELTDTMQGHNVLAIAGDTSFNWSDLYGIWTRGESKNIYTQYRTITIHESAVDDNKKYLHFLLTLPKYVGNASQLYMNVNGNMVTIPGMLSGTNNPYTSIIGNAEGSNHYVGTIRKLNVYNYIPSEEEAREILSVPGLIAYHTETISADMMEIGSLSNISEQLGMPVDWDEEIRTKDYIELPADAVVVSIDKYIDTDRIYFYNNNKTGIFEVTVWSKNEKVAIPSGAVYMKFLLKTTALIDVDVTYYK